MTRPVRARIDLPALQHNFERVRQYAPASRIMAVVKAHAYGHGLINAARALPGAHAFGVVSMDEAISLREAGFDRRIVLLEGLFGADETGLAEGYRVDVVVHHAGQIGFLEQARSGATAGCLAQDRYRHAPPGFRPGRCSRGRGTPAAPTGRVGAIRFLSHFCCADEANVRSHPAASAGFSCKRWRGWRGSVRSPIPPPCWPGPTATSTGCVPVSCCTAVSPLQHASAADLGLRPVMTLGTQLIAVKQRRQGIPWGTGPPGNARRKCPSVSRRSATGTGIRAMRRAGTPVLVNGRRAALAGRVSMDMIGIDLRGHPEARVGDPVTLWGEGLPVDEVASAAGTISYELFCG